MTASIVDGERWLAHEREALAKVELKPEARSIGRVEAIADGVARVSGLPETRLGDKLAFEIGQAHAEVLADGYLATPQLVVIILAGPEEHALGRRNRI